jgi:hypothetical protein
MGCCNLQDGGSYSASSATQCRPHAAYEQTTYQDNPCKGNCFLVTRLKNYFSDKAGKDDILTFASWSSIDFLYDFRDDVLKQCKTGVRILDLYNQHKEYIGTILDKDNDLVHEALELLLLGGLFARRVMIVRWRHKSRLSTDKPLDPEVLERSLVVLKQLRERASGNRLDEPVAFAEALLNRIRDLKPSQVWDLLKKTPKAALALPRQARKTR